MEQTFYPRTFSITAGMAPTAEGQVPVMTVTILDVGGTVVKTVWGLEDWVAFQRRR